VRGHVRPYRYRLDIHEPLARAVVEQGIERGFDLLHPGRPARLRLLRPAALRDAGARAAHRPAARQRVPAAPAHPRALPRLGDRARRDPPRAPGARGPHRLGRHVALSGHRPLRLARVRLRPRCSSAPKRRGREPRVTGGADKRGEIELRTWITLLGAVGDVRADVYCYEPSWHHGNAVVEWPVPVS
jgi:hypothetical protein